MLNALFCKEDIKIFKEVVSQEELFQQVSNYLLKQDYVSKEYFKELLLREEHFPTGLQLEKVAIAIPHVEGKYVKKSTIFVSLLKHPINWKSMEDVKKTLSVSIVFHLVLSQDEKHMAILQELIQLLQDSSFMEHLMKAESEHQIYTLLERRGLN
ncbi:PTS sugar transporter subunit IIA [Erysipelotrichaceae bacterium OH741_COT-311]|nr:PTS sugar transporter subunit IIA [Erysipelotrichaceae bacterium OH741_COT-311]